MSKVSGVILVGLEPSEWEILDAFEDPVYHLTLITLADGQQAWTYTCADSTSILDPDWSAGSFADHYLAGYVHRCTVWRRAVHLEHRTAAAAHRSTVLHDFARGHVHRRRAAAAGPAAPAPHGGPAPAPRGGSAPRPRRRPGGRRRPG